MADEARDLEANCADAGRRLQRTYAELARLWERSCPSTRWEQLLSLEDKEGLFFALKDLDLSFEGLRFLERLGERLDAKKRRSGVLGRGPYHSANFEELKTETNRLLRDLEKDVVVEEEERFLERKRRILGKLDKVTQLLESCERSERGALSYLSGKTVGLWLAAFAGACAMGYFMPAGVVGGIQRHILQQGRSVLPFAPSATAVRSAPAAFVVGAAGATAALVSLAHAVKGTSGAAQRARAPLEEPPAKRPRRS